MKNLEVSESGADGAVEPLSTKRADWPPLVLAVASELPSRACRIPGHQRPRRQTNARLNQQVAACRSCPIRTGIPWQAMIRELWI